MSGFADLAPQAQPAIVDEGAHGEGTAGRTWSWRITGVVDYDGDPIDLSSVTGTCIVVDDTPMSSTYDTVATLDFAGGLGEYTISLDKTDTADLWNGAKNSRRSCRWSLILDDGTTSVQVWGLSNSTFYIYRGA